MGKHHTQEYKEYVSKLVIEDGRKAAELSRELEISYKTLCTWVREYKTKLDKPTEEYITPSELEKLKKKHEKEMQQMRDENDILKKAMHIFTKNLNQE